ncbi:MAG: hypothetical protein KF819_26980 [Labilithrix sp.]|nr:hypothetical protein [Labilithrix sp.]
MRIFAFSALALSFSLLACATSDRVVIGSRPGTEGDTSAIEPAGQSAASFCSAMCTRVKSCDKTLDQQTCENTCTNQNAAVFPRLRGDVVDLIVACFDAKDCKTVLGGGVVGECASDALASVAPSAAASAFCDDLANKKKRCTTSSTALTSKADCLNSSKLYDDDAIAQAHNCTDRACTEIDGCVAAVFGGIGGATPTKPSGGSCSGKFTELGACTTCAQTSCCDETTTCFADSTCRYIVTSCVNNGVSSSSCSSAYSGASSSAQQAASAVLSCASSQCAATCSIN